jgi:hypothetical protein
MSKGIFSALCAAVCALSGTASAQDVAAQETGAVEASTTTPVASADAPAGSAINPGKLRILGGLHFGGGGELRSDPEVGPTSEDSLRPIVGLQAGADYVMMDYFAIGGEFRLSWFNTTDYDDLDIGRSLFVDINVKPRGRYVFDFPLEVYGTLPMGLSIAALSNDIEEAAAGVGITDIKGGAGFNLGFGGGANYFFTDKLGVNSEMLAVWHWFGSEVETTFGTSTEAKNRTAQFYLFLNFVYAL